MTITYDTRSEFIKIFIDDILHLAIRTSDVKTIRSWTNGESLCGIDMYFTGSVSKVEYNSTEKWGEVLRIINENL